MTAILYCLRNPNPRLSGATARHLGSDVMFEHAAQLDAHLAGREYLLDSGLSHAGFRMASCLAFNDVAALPLADYGQISVWYRRIAARTAWPDPFEGLDAPALPPIGARARQGQGGCYRILCCGEIRARFAENPFCDWPYCVISVLYADIFRSDPMQRYEYKVIPAPRKGEKSRGVKTIEDRFALALTMVMNDLGRDGWDYVRADTLPVDERAGFTGTKTTFQNMLVFRRAVAADSSLEPKLLTAEPAAAMPRLGPAEVPAGIAPAVGPANPVLPTVTAVANPGLAAE